MNQLELDFTSAGGERRDERNGSPTVVAGSGGGEVSNKTEYFNAKFAGDYLGDQWVVRGSDFDKLEEYHDRLREALREVLDIAEYINDYEGYCGMPEEYEQARALLTELDNLEKAP